MLYLSIIIPAYNEEQRISSTLDIVLDYFNTKDYKTEILVVDDGSNDKTVEIIREYSMKSPMVALVQNPYNQGKGAAVRRGMLHAQGQYLLFSDADLSAPIGDVERLIPYLEQGYDIAIGSRNIKDKDVKIVAIPKRMFMGRCFHWFVQSLILPGYKDTQCGFKLFKHDVAKHIFSLQKLDRFSFDVEILYLAKKHGYKVKEVAVNWVHVDNSRINLFSDPVQMFIDILKIKQLHP